MSYKNIIDAINRMTTLNQKADTIEEWLAFNKHNNRPVEGEDWKLIEDAVMSVVNGIREECIKIENEVKLATKNVNFKNDSF